MKKFKSLAAMLLAVAMTATLLAGCGGPSVEIQQPSNPPAPASDAPDAPASDAPGPPRALG